MLYVNYILNINKPGKKAYTLYSVYILNIVIDTLKATLFVTSILRLAALRVDTITFEAQRGQLSFS